MAAVSGLALVASAGMPTPLGSDNILGPVQVKALAANTGLIYIGNDGSGSVADDSGYQLSAGESIVFTYVGNLGTIMLDAAVSGEGVVWARLEV